MSEGPVPGLNAEQVAAYLHRSYTAVDGLWFMKVEEAYGFDRALDIDLDVWGVMPKIQARMLRQLMKRGDGIDNLLACLTTKLSIDGFRFSTEQRPGGFDMHIDHCVWHDLLVKSKREHLSGTIGGVICSREYSVWAAEFGDDIRFGLGDRLCRGGECCVLTFRRGQSGAAG